MNSAGHHSMMGAAKPPAPAYWGLYFEAEEPNCQIGMQVSRSGSVAVTTLNIETSPDGVAWTDFDCNKTSGGAPVTLANIGDRAYFRAKGTANNPAASNPAATMYHHFTLTKKAGAHGNIMSLVNGQEPLAAIPNSSQFGPLFDSCTNLTHAPDLPATTLSSWCYNNLFWGCTALSEAPELPATSPIEGCYYAMFHSCTALKDAPHIPFVALDTTNARQCCMIMFMGCSSMRSISVAFTTWGVVGGRTPSFGNWVQGVPATGTFTCPAALGSDNTISRGISSCPTGWTVVNT